MRRFPYGRFYGERAFFEKYNVRTDLALESHEVLVEREGPPELPGVKIETEKTEYATISRVTVENELGAQMMGKAQDITVLLKHPFTAAQSRSAGRDRSIASERVRVVYGTVRLRIGRWDF